MRTHLQSVAGLKSFIFDLVVDFTIIAAGVVFLIQVGVVSVAGSFSRQVYLHVAEA